MPQDRYVIGTTRHRADPEYFTPDDMIYVGKHGVDTDDGLSPEHAVLTITQGLVLAAVLVPAADNIIIVEIVDGKTYVEDLAIPSFVAVYGEKAAIDGQHTMLDNSHLRIGHLEHDGAGILISKVAGAGHCHVDIEEMILTGASDGLVCTSGEIVFNVQHLYVEDGFAIGSATTQEIHVVFNVIHITGAGYGIGTTAAGRVTAFGNCIEDDGAGTGIIVFAGSAVCAQVGHIDCNTAYNIAEGGTLDLHVVCLVGTETGVAAVMEVGSFRPWTPLVPTVDFATTAPAIHQLTMSVDMTATILVGMAVRFRIAGVYYYGIVTTMAAGLMTIAGAPFTLGAGDIDEVWFSADPSMVQQWDFFVQGNFGDGADAALLESDMELFFDWNLRQAHLVQFRIRADQADSGAAQDRINFRTGAGAAAVSTSNGNAGIAIVGGAWASTVVDIDVTNYVVNRDDRLEISVDGNGAAGDASDLSVSALFVFA